MPLIQGGPPEWIWERTSDPLKWELVPSQRSEGQTAYELKVQCGLGIMRLHFFTEDEIRELRTMLDEGLKAGVNGQQAEKGLEKSASELAAQRDRPVSAPDFHAFS